MLAEFLTMITFLIRCLYLLFFGLNQVIIFIYQTTKNFMSTPKAQFSLRLDYSMDEILKKFAISENRSQTAIIADALNMYFKANSIREFEEIPENECVTGNWAIYWTYTPGNNEDYSSVLIYCMDAPQIRMELTNVDRRNKEKVRKFLIEQMESLSEF